MLVVERKVLCPKGLAKRLNQELLFAPTTTTTTYWPLHRMHFSECNNVCLLFNLGGHHRLLFGHSFSLWHNGLFFTLVVGGVACFRVKFSCLVVFLFLLVQASSGPPSLSLSLPAFAWLLLTSPPILSFSAESPQGVENSLTCCWISLNKWFLHEKFRRNTKQCTTRFDSRLIIIFPIGFRYHYAFVRFPLNLKDLILFDYLFLPMVSHVLSTSFERFDFVWFSCCLLVK